MLFITTNTCNQDTYYCACCFFQEKECLDLEDTADGSSTCCDR